MAGKHKSDGVTPMSTSSPIDPFLADQGVLLLDGGLATELENKGYVLDSPLWSAYLLSTRPEAIREVHRAYLEAGRRPNHPAMIRPLAIRAAQASPNTAPYP